MKMARRFGSKLETFRFLTPATLIKMLALPEGDEEEFIATQAAAGNPVGKQSARDVQKNVKAFKQLRASKTSRRQATNVARIELVIRRSERYATRLICYYCS